MKITLIVLSFLFVTSVYCQDSGLLQFESRILNLGEVTKGTKVESAYTFTNTSNVDVEIDFVSTCVCTEADWTVGPIKPGESGTIEFIFDSNKKDDQEPIDVFVELLNTDDEENPLFDHLQYTFQLKD